MKNVLVILALIVPVAATAERPIPESFPRGIVAIIGMPEVGADAVLKPARDDGMTVYFQSDDKASLAAVRTAAEKRGLLGVRVFAELGSPRSIHLADNVADQLLITGDTPEAEALRAVRPNGVVRINGRQLTKSPPKGIDEWTHPYHGPDNNPQSKDELARGDFRTQFLGYPVFSPMPEQTVIAGGRIFKAMGHIAHKANQNEMLNTLLCINAYNGSILWRRDLPSGFMIHRNTMIATEDALYLADHDSCKVIDAVTGIVRDEITIPEEITDGPVWKWMAFKDGILYAMVGHEEIKVDTQPSTRPGLGHWPWGMWKGHDYSDLSKAFGFGRTLVAIDPKTKKKLWHLRESEYLDARALCLSGNSMFVYSPEKFLACVDTRDGSLRWKNSDEKLLAVIGPNGKAQHFITGYATTCYMKSTDDVILFAGPQRERTVAASTKDGSLLWTYPIGNLQLVLRDDGIWAASPQGTENGVRLDYQTGKVLAKFPARRACTRATGCIDSVFFRANGGTVRVMTESNTAQHIDPMRPPCQDGVIVSNGHLYWGPWMCGCQLSLYGNICLAPTTRPTYDPKSIYQHALKTEPDFRDVQPLDTRADTAVRSIPNGVNLAWEAQICTGELPTAPVVAGGLVFVADRTGAIRALTTEGKAVWKAHAGGAIYSPPVVAHDRLYVGAANGRVYAFEAATGRKLWNFRVAPQERRIPVYGKLISSWPVAGGVVVAEDTVYAAAGITHYDGTFVVALDARTGELKAQNTASGTLEPNVENGISLQGELRIEDGELRFLAGGVYELARYDLKTLECLNTPVHQVHSQYRTAFYPYYPEYGKYVSLDHADSNGRSLTHDASYEGSMFTNLCLREPYPPGTPKPRKEESRWTFQRGVKLPPIIWQDTHNRRFTSFVLAGDRLLATGHPDGNPKERFLVATSIKDGSDTWMVSLPALSVKGGTALDATGRIFVTLEDGRLLGFAPTGK